MMRLINDTRLKEVYTLGTYTAVKIPARLDAAGVSLDEVCEVLSMLYKGLSPEDRKKNCTVMHGVVTSRAANFPARAVKVFNALSPIWHDYAKEYNKIISDGICCTTQGAWDVFKNLKKKLKKGKGAAFTAGGVRLTVESKDKILIKYGDSMEKTLVFIRKGDSFAIDACASDFTTCKKENVWLNVTTGYALYTKAGLFQDILHMVQAPLWNDDERPVHMQYELCPSAPVTGLQNLSIRSADMLGLDSLRTLCEMARRFYADAKC